MTKKLLYQFDPDPHPSVFDNVAHDGGADQVTPYGGITPQNVGGLVEGAIFTRRPKRQRAIDGAHIVIATGSAGTRLLTESAWSGQAQLEVVCDSNPTPGGGGAAAVMGAMGAALISMVANLTIGKKGFEGVDAEMRALLADSEALRLRLAAMVAEDAAAFDSLMAAYRRPKVNEADITARREAIQQGLKLAILAPLQCARASADGIRLAARAVERSNPQAVSDVGVGVQAS